MSSCLLKCHCYYYDVSMPGPCETKYCAFGAYCAVDGGVAVCRCRDHCEGTLYSPVCGADGTTYDSLCHLHRTSCEQQKRIAVLARGVCGKCHSYL